MPAIWWGTPCDTNSLARKWDGGPPPLRTDEYPNGEAPWLTPQERHRVLIGNILSDFTALGMIKLKEAGGKILRLKGKGLGEEEELGE